MGKPLFDPLDYGTTALTFEGERQNGQIYGRTPLTNRKLETNQARIRAHPEIRGYHFCRSLAAILLQQARGDLCRPYVGKL